MSLTGIDLFLFFLCISFSFPLPTNMEKSDNLLANGEIKDLRERIKAKYNQYHLRDRDRFPLFDYNTNRANYEPLVDSFIEEFYTVRGIEPKKNTLHIPSARTLASIFCNDNYVPGIKILNTCRSYAEGPSRVADETGATVTKLPEGSPKATKTASIQRVGLAGLVFLTGIAVYAAITHFRAASRPSGLIMHRPYTKQTVSRRPVVEGKVSNADTVWIVVRPVGLNEYYMQPPVRVDYDGTWRSQIYVGTIGKENIGSAFHVRAFVNPAGAFKVLEEYERDVFNRWPDAELSTDIVEVVRGPEVE